MKSLEKRDELEPLTREEAFTVHIYTQDSWVNKEVNRRLRLRERQSLKPFFPYLKLFLTGLHRLEPVDDTVYRGVKLDLAAKYGVDDDIVWWAFSSATATAGVSPATNSSARPARARSSASRCTVVSTFAGIAPWAAKTSV